MGPLGAKWRPKEAKTEARFDKKTVPKIDAGKVSKNPPTLGVAKQTELLGGGLPPPYPPPLGHPWPKRPKKVKRWKK